jgi:hypothetical protein
MVPAADQKSTPPSVPRLAVGLLAVVALALAVWVWCGDGAGGTTAVTTTSGTSTVMTTTTAQGVQTVTTPGKVMTETTPGRPARSAESALELFLLGSFVVLILGAVSKGPVTITMPGGGSVQIGATAQAQLSGAIAQRYTEPAKAETAYLNATAAIQKGGYGRRVDTLSDDDVNHLVESVGRIIPFDQGG